jgi:uncharacterized membrane protein YtjA (UPF0391 family)
METGPIFAQVFSRQGQREVTATGEVVSNSIARHTELERGDTMWRWALFFILLALLSGALCFAAQSSTAAGLAVMLLVAFTGLAGMVLALDGGRARAI